jgi:hypothetical protein
MPLSKVPNGDNDGKAILLDNVLFRTIMTCKPGDRPDANDTLRRAVLRKDVSPGLPVVLSVAAISASVILQDALG